MFSHIHTYTTTSTFTSIHPVALKHVNVRNTITVVCFEPSFTHSEQCIWTDALVSGDIEEVMLGIDWLKQNDCVWDFRTRKLSIMGRPTVALTRRAVEFLQEYDDMFSKGTSNG